MRRDKFDLVRREFCSIKERSERELNVGGVHVFIACQALKTDDPCIIDIHPYLRGNQSHMSTKEVTTKQTLVTFNGIPVTIELHWPYHPSPSGADWFVLHGKMSLE